MISLKRLLMALIGTLAYTLVAFAQESANPVNTLPGMTPTASSYLQIREFLRDEDADRYAEMFSDFVVSGGLHATAGGLSSTAFATIAYAGGYRINQSASAITYPNNDTCWVIAQIDTTGNQLTFTRVSGTHYLIDCASSTQPTLPTNSTWLMKVKTLSGAITLVTDLRSTTPLTAATSASVGTFTNVMDFCANNGGTVDNSDCFTSLFNTPGSYWIPEGTYRLDRFVRITHADNVYILMDANALIKYYGACAWGGVFVIRNADNVWIEGGTIDSNQQGNDNTIAVTGQTICEDFDFGATEFCTTNGDCTENTQTGVCRTDKAKGIRITNTNLKNARAADSGACNALEVCGDQTSACIGEGGGKGISLQFGVEDVFIDNVKIDNCDIGLSVECKSDASFNGGCENITVSNVTIRDSEWMCMYLLGSNVSPPAEGDYQPIVMTNVQCDDCAIGKTNQGVVTAESAFNYQINNLRIRNKSGAVTAWRGVTRQSKVDMYVDAFTLTDLFNFSKAESANGSTLTSQYNDFRAYLKVRDDITDALITHDGTNAVAGSNFDVGFLWWDGTNYSANLWPGPAKTCSASVCATSGEACTNNDDCSSMFKYSIPTTVSYRIQNLSTGDVMQGIGPLVPVETDIGTGCVNGFVVEKDAAAGVVALRPCDNDYVPGMRSIGGSTQVLFRNEGVFLGNSFGDNSALSLTGTDTSPDVTDDFVVWLTPSGATVFDDFEDAANTHAAFRDNTIIYVVAKNANATLDCTSSDIFCNNGVDFAMKQGDVATCILDKTADKWYCATGR